MPDNAKGAISLLHRGVQLDSEKRYTEALVHYQEGLQMLIDAMKCMSDPVKKKQVHQKIEEYMSRAERLKQYVNKQKEEGKYHEQIKIEDNSTGNGYQKVFGRFLSEDVEEIRIEDPYIRAYHQCQNFLRFCELACKSCPQLKRIFLTTTREGDDKKDKEQEGWLSKLFASLLQQSITLTVVYSSTLHDRQIILSNGWIIKIGRGLDYFKAPENNMSLGSCDVDLRRCHETVVDVFHNSAVRSS
ncbi:Protein of unknown function [Gryllus bimaculatus]|nr:Protein of unknown function [Gryllus bimaculatus]